MKVVFFEVIRGFWKNSYKELGVKELDVVPTKGDGIYKDGKYWEVLLRRFIFDKENGDYIKLYIEPFTI